MSRTLLPVIPYYRTRSYFSESSVTKLPKDLNTSKV